MSTASETQFAATELRHAALDAQAHASRLIDLTDSLLSKFGHCQDCGPDQVYFAADLKHVNGMPLCREHAAAELPKYDAEMRAGGAKP